MIFLSLNGPQKKKQPFYLPLSSLIYLFFFCFYSRTGRKKEIQFCIFRTTVFSYHYSSVSKNGFITFLQTQSTPNDFVLNSLMLRAIVLALNRNFLLNQTFVVTLEVYSVFPDVVRNLLFHRLFAVDSSAMATKQEVSSRTKLVFCSQAQFSFFFPRSSLFCCFGITKFFLLFAATNCT